jgi:uncharacterized membrane protein YfcA
MDLIAAIRPLYAASGFVVGLLVGMTGVGGGSLMTPVLILLFGIHPATAVGTDLIYAAATKSFGTFTHGFSRTVDWHVVGRLAGGSLPATALTLFALSRIDLSGGTAHRLITAVLGAALLLTAAALIFRRALLERYAQRVDEFPPQRTAWLTVLTGAALGVLVSISSVGAGAIGVSALLLLYPRLPMVKIVGSDIAHAVPLTLAAGLGHWVLGGVDVGLLGSLLAGSVPGIVLGSLLASRVPERLLRFMLAGMLIVVGSRLLM